MYSSFESPPLAGCRGGGAAVCVMKRNVPSGYVLRMHAKVSSLLFGISDTSIIDMRSTQDRSSVGDIELYVIEITLIPQGTFLRDQDLKRAFGNFTIIQGGKNLKSYLGI